MSTTISNVVPRTPPRSPDGSGALGGSGEPGGYRFWRRLWSGLTLRPASSVGLVIILGIVICVVAAPWIAPYGPNTTDYNAILAGPSHTHWFGTDNLGRDIFSRILYGGRATLEVALLGVLLAAAGGTVLGMLGGYFGGWIDAALMRLVDVWLSFPVILVILSIIAILGPGTTTVVMSLGLAAIPAYARVVRGSVLAVRERDYVIAARLSGAGNLRVMGGHILPSVAGVLAVYVTLGLGAFIIAVSGLDFLGLGTQPPSPEWGAMLSLGNDYLSTAWWMSVFPGVAIFLSVLGINLVGIGLRDALDPRTSRLPSP